MWIFAPYTWHQKLGCLVTRPACSSGPSHHSGMHSLSIQRTNMSVAQQLLSNTSATVSSLQHPCLFTSLPLCCFCLYSYIIYIVYSKTISVFSPTPHNLSAHRNTYTQPFILSCSCRLKKKCMEFRDTLISSKINSQLPLYLVWTLGSVPGSPHQRGSYCLFQKSKREKDGQGEGKKHRHKTGSASSQRAEEEKWVEGEQKQWTGMLDRTHR